MREEGILPEEEDEDRILTGHCYFSKLSTSMEHNGTTLFLIALFLLFLVHLKAGRFHPQKHWWTQRGTASQGTASQREEPPLKKARAEDTSNPTVMVLVQGLPEHTTAKDLQEHFTIYGKVMKSTWLQLPSMLSCFSNMFILLFCLIFLICLPLFSPREVCKACSDLTTLFSGGLKKRAPATRGSQAI